MSRTESQDETSVLSRVKEKAATVIPDVQAAVSTDETGMQIDRDALVGAVTRRLPDVSGPTNDSRRNFLRGTGAVVGSSAMAACMRGQGAEPGEESANGSDGSEPTESPVPTEVKERQADGGSNGDGGDREEDEPSQGKSDPGSRLTDPLASVHHEGESLDITAQSDDVSVELGRRTDGEDIDIRGDQFGVAYTNDKALMAVAPGIDDDSRRQVSRMVGRLENDGIKKVAVAMDANTAKGTGIKGTDGVVELTHSAIGQMKDNGVTGTNVQREEYQDPSTLRSSIAPKTEKEESIKGVGSR